MVLYQSLLMTRLAQNNAEQHGGAILSQEAALLKPHPLPKPLPPSLLSASAAEAALAEAALAKATLVEAALVEAALVEATLAEAALATAPAIRRTS